MLRRFMLFISFVFSTIIGYSIDLFAQATLIDEPDRLIQHLNAIDEIQTEYSTYASELGELYMSLGKIHEARKEYPQALVAYQRGMQTERINHGLDSVSQTPFLFAVADIEGILGEWEKSFEAIDYIYDINASYYGASDPRMISVLETMLRWHMAAYSKKTQKDGFSHLVASENISTQLAEVLEKNWSENHAVVAKRFQEIASLHFLIADHIARHGDLRETGFRITTGNINPQLSQPSTSHEHFQKGRDALQNAVKITNSNPDSTTMDKAIASAKLGDWFLIFNQRSSAAKAYKTASDALYSGPNGEFEEKLLFGLPKLINLKSDISSIASDTRDATIIFSVSKTGVASQFRAIDQTHPLSNNEKNALRKDFRGKRFRPVIEKGESKKVDHSLYYGRVMSPPKDSNEQATITSDKGIPINSI
jgi:tetratricopeptide (TPR) repeat protein